MALCVILHSVNILCHYAVSFCCVYKMPGVLVSRRDLRFSLFLKSEQETKKKTGAIENERVEAGKSS